MKFDLGAEVGALEYDFTTVPNCPPELADAKGLIPEPSTELVDYFFEKRNELNQVLAEWAAEQEAAEDEDEEPAPTVKTKRVTKAATKTTKTVEPESLEQRLGKWLTDPGKSNAPERVAVRDAMIDLLAKVCQGSPSREQIAALRHRHRVAFMEWLTTELLDPKGSLRSATTN